MAVRELILVGAGGHAAACIDVIEQDGGFRVAGLLGLPGEVGRDVLGYPVIASDEELSSVCGTFKHFLIVVGQIKSADARVKLFEAIKANGCNAPTIVSPRAYVSPRARLGEGTIVMHGAIVNARATVGRNCIVNTKALIEHDAVIGDHCHVATGALINGGASVGTRSFVGSNSVVRQGVRIGDQCLVGMGQVVRKDCPNMTNLPGVVL